MPNIPSYIIVHHTGGSDANPLQDSSNFTFKQCDDLHKQMFNMRSSLGFYVGYHYYIEKDGKLYQARSDSDEGAHTKGYNSSSLGICLAGNFDLSMPTEAQKNTLRTLLSQKVAQYSLPITRIVPHRKFANKTCYGKNLSDTWAQSLLLDPSAATNYLAALNSAMNSKDYKKAKDLTSYLFTELTKLI